MMEQTSTIIWNVISKHKFTRIFIVYYECIQYNPSMQENFWMNFVKYFLEDQLCEYFCQYTVDEYSL